MKRIKREDKVFDIREDYYTDEIVVREIWDENVYEVNGGRFDVEGITVDIGANIGAFAILAAHHGSRVLAVEPEPHNLEAMRNNIAINGLEQRIIVSDVGVSDYTGTAVINDGGGGASIYEENADGVFIDVITLDQLFERYNVEKVNVLKIDVEGSEVAIVLGASRENLDKCAYITLEFDHRTGEFMGDIVRKLSETHHVRTMGRWSAGGMIWAWRY